jgi:glutamate dehydrogenase/leucine dehydrogenase
MIPKNMKAYLDRHLPAGVLQNRLIRKGSRCYLELAKRDERLLAALGITTDRLGPFLVSCMWDEASPLEIGGYLVVDNLSMGKPAMGGIRMLPQITPLDIHNLARGMTLKNGAANLPYGGGKSGIVAPERQVDSEEHTGIVRGFARLIRRYTDIYVPGPDVGTNDADMKTIAVENGLDSAVSKTADMGGNRIDELGAAAGGVVIALETLLRIMPRLKVLPQFRDLVMPEEGAATVLFQGFGAVGAHAARIMQERLPNALTTGLSDFDGYLHHEKGLPVDELFQLWQKQKLVTKAFYQDSLCNKQIDTGIKFSNDRNDLLRESAFCLVPAAAVFNYLGVDHSDKAAMTVDRMGKWRLIVEGANTYSPDPNKKAQRTQLEQILYREKGIMLANDYLVNSGGVIFAAQEYYLPTPGHLQIPPERLGKPAEVQAWLDEHAAEFAELSQKRKESGEEWREKVISANMVELLDHLTKDHNLLPCQAAERISLERLSAREEGRLAKDIMIDIALIHTRSPLQLAAEKIVERSNNMAAVVDDSKMMAGVITAWDVTQAVARNPLCGELKVDQVMQKEVVAASPGDSLPGILRKLEENRISAMPVVKDGKVLGLVNSDVLAYSYLRNQQKP